MLTQGVENSIPDCVNGMILKIHETGTTRHDVTEIPLVVFGSHESLVGVCGLCDDAHGRVFTV
jgi:hypothetical protein